jgi:hypothetical protein
MQSTEIQPTFRRKFFSNFQSGRILRARNQNLSPALMLASLSAYFSTLKIEAVCSSKTSVDFQQGVLFQFTRHWPMMDKTLNMGHEPNPPTGSSNSETHIRPLTATDTRAELDRM